jgi:hypothetical protein
VSYVPLILKQATIALYPQSLDDRPQRGRPVWLGGVAEGLNLDLQLGGKMIYPAGKLGGIQLSGAAEHRIECTRLWVQRMENATEAVPRRGRHVLELTWQDPESGLWLRRRYRDACFQSGRWTSRGRFESAFAQVFVAGRLEALGGLGEITDPVTSASDIRPSPMFFVGPGPILASDPTVAVLVGRYAFARGATFGTVAVAANSAGSGDTVLQLFLSGSPVVGATVTLAAGETAAGADWSALVTLAATLPGTAITCRAISGPTDPAACPADLSVSVNLVLL